MGKRMKKTVFLMMLVLVLCVLPRTQAKAAVLENVNEYLQNDKETLLAVGTAGGLNDFTATGIYQKKDYNSKKYGDLQYNCAVVVRKDKLKPDTQYEWYPVVMPNYDNRVCYVQAKKTKLVSLKLFTSEKKRNKIMQEAILHLGSPYRRWQDSYETGIDCSRFVSRVFKDTGVKKNIPLYAAEIGRETKKIAKSDAKPGDIVCYMSGGTCEHVGIYLRKNYIISSAGHSGKYYPAGGIRISNIKYTERYNYEIHRVIKDEEPVEPDEPTKPGVPTKLNVPTKPDVPTEPDETSGASESFEIK